MPRVVHFEIPANDPEKVGAFYQNVFGWKVHKWDGPFDYRLVQTGERGTPGIDGGLFAPENGMPHQTINVIEVDDLDAFAEGVATAGGRLVTERMDVPEVGSFRYCADPEGTVFGLMQPVAVMSEG